MRPASAGGGSPAAAARSMKSLASSTGSQTRSSGELTSGALSKVV
jgi:hypothetical protein